TRTSTDPHRRTPRPKTAGLSVSVPARPCPSVFFPLWRATPLSWHSHRMETQTPCLDLAELARDAGPNPNARVSTMASGLVGSEILRIAGEIRALVAAGR